VRNPPTEFLLNGVLGSCSLPSYLAMRWTSRDGIMLVAESEDSPSNERVGKEHTERAMHARVSKLEGLPEQVDELGRIATEWLAPSLSEMEGFHTILALADRQSGKVELVTLWESEQAMHQSEQDADQLRSATARAAGGEVAEVQRYEVVLLHTS
jgi:heme-degrading monooxygenase HmoA